MENRANPVRKKQGEVKRKITLALLAWLALFGAGVQADPLSDVPRERRSYTMTALPAFTWYPTYDIEFSSQNLRIYTSIYLSPLSGVTQEQIDALEPVWEAGIEDRWNNRYQILHNSEYTYGIIFDVTFAGNYLPSRDHYQVLVRPGPDRSYINLWDTADTGRVVAHEYGHMVGNYDEYSGGALDPNNPIIDTTSLMGGTSDDVVTYARNYEGVVTWLRYKYPFDTLEVVAIPEPATLGLLLMGGLVMLRKRLG